jgi:hypothetical protein
VPGAEQFCLHFFPYKVMQRGYGGANRLIEDYCARNRDLHFIHTFKYFTTPEGLPDSTFFRKGYRQWSGIIKTSLKEAGIGP